MTTYHPIIINSLALIISGYVFYSTVVKDLLEERRIRNLPPSRPISITWENGERIWKTADGAVTLRLMKNGDMAFE